MHPHIIGEDSLCVYPHCRQPNADLDSARELFFFERFFGCFQDNFDELERTRLELQDAEYIRASMAQKPQKSKPSVPMVPRGKKNRHPKKHKPRALALPPVSGIIHEVSDLRCSNCCFNFATHSVSRLDCICNEVVILESVRDDLARLAVVSLVNFDNPVCVPVPNMVGPTISRATSNLSPHPPPPPPPPTTTTTTTITTDPLSDVYGNVFDDDDVDSDDCEPDDYSYM